MPTKIEWCDETINPIQDVRKGKSGRGYHCTKCSPGCLNCYAERINKIRGNGLPFDNAPCEFDLIDKELDKLSRWKKPRSVFIQSMGDLFHEDVPCDFIHHILDRPNQTYYHINHTLLLLTKRPQNVINFISNPVHGRMKWHSNIYLGLTVCNQQEWNDKGKLFLQIPGKKFISHEPALERIDYGEGLKEISCLISGGETGSGARPSHVNTFRADRNQCQAVGVPFFLKSVGERILDRDVTKFDALYKAYKTRYLDGRTHDDLPWVQPEDVWKVGG
jgi:protein gp37